MSDRIYACLLWLFPSHFRQKFGDEALQLFRDRVRDESGFFLRLRLWLDLLLDLVISLPSAYRYGPPELASASATCGLYGIPSFFFFQPQPLRPAALLLGGASSLLLLCAVWLSLANSPPAPTLRLGPSPQSSSESQPQQVLQPSSQEAAAASSPAARESFALDAGERRRVVEAAAAILRKHYIDRENAQKMANALLIHEQHGDDDSVADGAAFASLLTRQMREVSPDRHLTLDYSPEPLPDRPAEPTAVELAQYRAAILRENCAFQTIRTLPGNIGYLKLSFFPDPSVCRATAEAAMALLNDADAIIFDLRDNRGGEPTMVALIAAYLFDHPEYWYNPRENTTERSWTKSPVPGNKLADKPAYILTSRHTFSGAEQFCYDLKMLKRATLVGETTGGAAHSGVWHRIDDHFGMGVPETKPLNPFPSPDWAETGVEPDVKVNAADALQTAEKMVRSKSALTRRSPN